MICYRLRDKGNRFSLMATGKYMLSYPIGAIVTAPKGTLGIFCFERRMDAEFFRDRHDFLPESTEIYKVRGIGTVRYPIKICIWLCEWELNNFYELGENTIRGISSGIVLFDEVEVLE